MIRLLLSTTAHCLAPAAQSMSLDGLVKGDSGRSKARPDRG